MAGSPALEKLLNSTVIVAVIGLFGAFLTSQYQERSKRNEIGLAAFRESQTAQTAVVTEAFNIIGAYIAAVDDLIALTSSDFSTESRSAAEKARLVTFFEETQGRHDKADVIWRAGKYSVGYRLVYHHEGRVEVSHKWTALVSTVDALEECGNSWYQQHGPGTADLLAARPCEDKRRSVDAGIEALTRTLNADHRYLWDPNQTHPAQAKP